ncbi:uncharacterized protein LOC144155876 [Haemaphysalis longicornis]
MDQRRAIRLHLGLPSTPPIRHLHRGRCLYHPDAGLQTGLHHIHRLHSTPDGAALLQRYSSRPYWQMGMLASMYEGHIELPQRPLLKTPPLGTGAGAACTAMELGISRVCCLPFPASFTHTELAGLHIATDLLLGKGNQIQGAVMLTDSRPALLRLGAADQPSSSSGYAERALAAKLHLVQSRGGVSAYRDLRPFDAARPILAREVETMHPDPRVIIGQAPQHCNRGAGRSSSSQVQCHSLLLLRSPDPGLPHDVITSVGSVDSAFLTQCTPSINSYTSADLPALLVLIQYLVQLEGPMWRQIRGQGLSYNYNLHVRPSEGLLYFVLTKSTLVAAAYREAMHMVQRHLAGDEEWDEELVEAARSSLMFELIEKEKGVSEVALQSLLAYHRNIDTNYTRNLLEKVAAVTLPDMIRVGKQYLSSVFDPAASRLAICCHPSKVEDTVNAFKEFNRSLQVVTSLDDSIFARY